jgi:hypothetical protein
MQRMELVLLLALGVLGTACGHHPGPADGGNVTVSSVNGLLLNPPADGTDIAINGAVVVAQSASSTDGKVYIQDAGGGPQSVIRAQCTYGGTKPNCVGSKQLTELHTRGEVVNVTGKVLHIHTGAPPDVSMIVIDQADVVGTSSSLQAVATPVQAAEVAKDQIASLYRGTYVQITDGPFQVTNITPYEFHKQCTGSTMTHYRGFEVASSGGTTLAVGLTFDKSLTFCLPDPCSTAACTNVIDGGYSQVLGIVEADYDGMPTQAFLKVMPTDDLDLPR